MQSKKPVGKILMAVDSISPHLYDPKPPTPRFMSIPGTIEDEMPPVSQAFVDKVKAMGGIMTPYGLVCDPSAPVTGKRYMRLAKAVFCILYSLGDRHVEDVEFRIRNFAQRDKQGSDWMGMNEDLANRLRLAIMNRHSPGLRNAIYANKG